MNKFLLLPLTVMLASCSITAEPLHPKFPEAPATLQEKCATLKEASEGMTLSEFTKVVVQNYVLYHECERKLEGWNEWYTNQKKIFESATK